MSLDVVVDLLTGAFLILGAFLSLAAGVGVLRFPDAIARMHATTKPQILGLIFVLTAIALQERRWSTILMLATLLLFQMMTAPISAHMIGRAGYRTGVVAPGSLLVDELAEAVERAQDEQSDAGEEGASEESRGHTPG
ncbi:MAG TPA: monovalent cation/H(+) antiporter subunit G [Terrimesophilobacter sp.]|nr:monovalent cation/H(+) antiporter subunit G [Terrimesophilobacter sp.]